jgi:predicted nucleotide-binding protein (sugar kinase/HSP70/actin superfamily)
MTIINNKKRIVSFPHMGNICIPVSAMLKTMGANVYLPPANNKETLSLGTRHSAETVCLPYKMNLGNYIHALESGANVLLMFQAPGTCRLGNYASMAESKLRELGYDFEMVVFDMYKGKLVEISKKFAIATGNTNITKTLYGIKLGFTKFNALDTIERRLFYVRPRELEQGRAERIYKAGRMAIDAAMTTNEVNKAMQHSLRKFDAAPINDSKKRLKVYLTGEFFVLLDSFANMNVEKELGKLGVDVERQIMLSDWTNGALLPKWLNKKESHRERSSRVAGKYMTRAIGGECLESIGDAVYASRSDIDGVIHLGPFNCNPEIVTQCILPHISKNENIPIISFMMDEQTGKTGFVTRLEAFVDLIHRKKEKNITTELCTNIC